MPYLKFSTAPKGTSPISYNYTLWDCIFTRDCYSKIQAAPDDCPVKGGLSVFQLLMYAYSAKRTRIKKVRLSHFEYLYSLFTLYMKIKYSYRERDNLLIHAKSYLLVTQEYTYIKQAAE